MKKIERVKIIIKRLEEIYPETPIPLDHKNDYTLLVAVVLSAQSTDKKVNEITKPLFMVAPSAVEMYKLGEEYYSIIKTFLLYLNRIDPQNNTGIFANINIDNDVLDLLNAL